MSQHSRTEKRLKQLTSRCVILVVPTTSFLEAIDCKLLIRIAQPFGTSREVGQKEYDR